MADRKCCHLYYLSNSTSGYNILIFLYPIISDEVNVAVMHAFVDELDFSNMNFVDALRHLLQTFRLPGEGQKIDRFMLKFAERYIHFNPNTFANAGKFFYYY